MGFIKRGPDRTSPSAGSPSIRSLATQPPPNNCNKPLERLEWLSVGQGWSLRLFSSADSYASGFCGKGGPVLERCGLEEEKWSGSIGFHWGSLLRKRQPQQKVRPANNKHTGNASLHQTLTPDESRLYGSGWDKPHTSDPHWEKWSTTSWNGSTLFLLSKLLEVGLR